jgi:hypothetical protein
MRKNLFAEKILVFLLFLPLVLFFSCGGKTTTRSTKPKYKFTINGVVVKDLSLSKDIAYFTVLRDSAAFDTAVVKIGQDTIKSQGGGIYSKEASHLFDFKDAVTITVSSPTDNFNFRYDAIIPGNFEITGKNHDPVTANLVDEVIVYFNSSAKATGYFISVKRPDGSDGYTKRVPPEYIGAMKLLRDTFYVGDTFTTGTYIIYLISYYKSFIGYPTMKFCLPDDIPKDNISGANGTIGAGVVAPLDSIKAE